MVVGESVKSGVSSHAAGGGWRPCRNETRWWRDRKVAWARAALSTLDALRTISQNAVLYSSIQRTSSAPTPDASRCHSIRDIETPSCLLRRADRPGYVWRRSSSCWCF